MHTHRNTLDRVLDEALEMTFPASDPVAVAAPGSTSDKGETEPPRDAPAEQAEKPARDENEHRKS